MNNSFEAANEVRDLSRDLLYCVERLNLSPEGGAQVFNDAILPRLRQAEERFAECCGCPEKKPVQNTSFTDLSVDRKLG